MTAFGYVVILFGSEEPNWCSLSHCPLGTAQWFKTKEEADTYARAIPSGFEPHLIRVERNDRPTDSYDLPWPSSGFSQRPPGSTKHPPERPSSDPPEGYTPLPTDQPD